MCPTNCANYKKTKQIFQLGPSVSSVLYSYYSNSKEKCGPSSKSRWKKGDHWLKNRKIWKGTRKCHNHALLTAYSVQSDPKLWLWPLNCFNVFGRLVCNMKRVTQIENVGKTNAKWSQGEAQIGPGRPLFATLWVTSYLPGHTWRVTITFALFLFGLMKWSEYKLMKMWHKRKTKFDDFSAVFNFSQNAMPPQPRLEIKIFHYSRLAVDER